MIIPLTFILRGRVEAPFFAVLLGGSLLPDFLQLLMEPHGTEAFILMALGVMVVALRSYARISTTGWRKLGLDDVLMVVARAAFAIETGLAYTTSVCWHGLANNGMTAEQRRLLDPNSDEYAWRVGGSKTQVAGWQVYTTVLWTVKLAVFCFYLRLMHGLLSRARICLSFALLLATWLAVVLTLLLSCRPLARYWQIQPDPGSLCRPATSPLNIFTVLILNILTDLYLMSIPLPLLWSSSFSPLKKAGLTLLFSGGAFVICAGTARCVLILRHPVSGAQKSGSWAVRETFVAIVTANMPLVVPLVRRWAVVLWKVLVLWGVSLPGESLSWGSRASSKSEEGGGNGNGNGNGKVRGRWQNGGYAGSSRPRSLLPLSVDLDVDGGEDLIEAVCLGRISVGTFAAMPEVHYGPVVGGLHGEVLRKTSYQFLDV